jgi:hypothetical protein
MPDVGSLDYSERVTGTEPRIYIGNRVETDCSRRTPHRDGVRREPMRS